MKTLIILIPSAAIVTSIIAWFATNIMPQVAHVTNALSGR